MTHVDASTLTSPATVTIVTVTYHASEFIDDYLQSIKALLLTDSRFSVVIVDNASGDNTANIVQDFIRQEMLGDRIRFCVSPSNSGFGAGCNLGASLAPVDTHYLWFLNPDTQFEASAGTTLLQAFSTREHVDALASILHDADGSVVIGAFRFPWAMTTFLSHACIGLLDRCFGQYALHYKSQDSQRNADWLSGASFMIRANAFHQVNGFDETFFLYFEEVDLFYRFKQAGFTAAICSQSVVNHIAGASTGVNNHARNGQLPRKPAYWFESRRYLYIKHFGRGYLLFIDTVYVLANLLHRTKNFCLRKPLVQPKRLLRDIVKFSGWR